MDLRLNETYYFASSSGDYTCKGVYTGPVENDTYDLSGFKDVYTVNRKGETLHHLYKNTVIFTSEVFKSLEDLITDMDNKYEHDVQYCKNKIKTINDLVLFALENELYGEDIDYAAREAYISRASELLGIPEEKLKDA